MSVFTNWGSKPHERKMDFSCNRLVADINGQYFRAVDINAPPDLVYKWLLQMRVAPYSYDKLDNGGKTSPQILPQVMLPLERNQKVMTIFNVEEFIPEKEITVSMDMPPGKWSVWYVPTAITYKVIKTGKDTSRVLVKYVAHWSNTLRGLFEHYFIIFADFIMMRRQLLNFKRLSERDFRKHLTQLNTVGEHELG